MGATDDDYSGRSEELTLQGVETGKGTVEAITFEEAVTSDDFVLVDGEVSVEGGWDVLVTAVGHDYCFRSNRDYSVPLEIVSLNNKITIRQYSDS